MDSNDFKCCCRALPEASVPQALAEVIDYLIDHPGWSSREIIQMLKEKNAIVDDSNVAVDTTFSSSKINTLLNQINKRLDALEG